MNNMPKVEKAYWVQLPTAATHSGYLTKGQALSLVNQLAVALGLVVKEGKEQWDD